MVKNMTKQLDELAGTATVDIPPTWDNIAGKETPPPVFARRNTAEMIKEARCRTCHWPVIHVCVNWDTSKFPVSEDWDWWGYCSNKACEHHEGEGWFQDTPEFIEYSRK